MIHVDDVHVSVNDMRDACTKSDISSGSGTNKNSDMYINTVEEGKIREHVKNTPGDKRGGAKFNSAVQVDANDMCNVIILDEAVDDDKSDFLGGGSQIPANYNSKSKGNNVLVTNYTKTKKTGVIKQPADNFEGSL